MEKEEETILKDIEENGLKKMRMLIEFLTKNKGSEKVRDYMTKVGSDDALILLYLKGRKYRPEHAWQTAIINLKRKAELRFDEYPEIHTPEHFVKSGAWGTLRNKDKYGRRVLCAHGEKWDPSQKSTNDVTITLVYSTERLLLVKEALENGIVWIKNCEVMGMKYTKQYTLPVMLRMLHVLSVVLTTTSKIFEALDAKIDPAILPKSLGGDQEEYEAFDMRYFR